MSVTLDGCNLIVRVDAINNCGGMKKFIRLMSPYLNMTACCDGCLFKVSTNNPGMLWFDLEKMFTKFGLKKLDYIMGDFFDEEIPCKWAEFCRGEDGMRIRMKGADAPHVLNGDMSFPRMRESHRMKLISEKVSPEE